MSIQALNSGVDRVCFTSARLPHSGQRNPTTLSSSAIVPPFGFLILTSDDENSVTSLLLQAIAVPTSARHLEARATVATYGASRGRIGAGSLRFYCVAPVTARSLSDLTEVNDGEAAFCVGPTFRVVVHPVRCSRISPGDLEVAVRDVGRDYCDLPLQIMR
jgi:hypothetical protein